MDKWAVSNKQLDCYNTFRSRIESEDRWIVARIQIVVLSQGFLFAGLGAFGPSVLHSSGSGDLKIAALIAVIGFVIGLFGAWGVHAAVTEIAKLKATYEQVQIKPAPGLPDLHSDATVHDQVANRAILFTYLLCAVWLAMLVYVLWRL